MLGPPDGTLVWNMRSYGTARRGIAKVMLTDTDSEFAICRVVVCISTSALRGEFEGWPTACGAGRRRHGHQRQKARLPENPVCECH